jgi:hypothetical protein
MASETGAPHAGQAFSRVRRPRSTMPGYWRQTPCGSGFG